MCKCDREISKDEKERKVGIFNNARKEVIEWQISKQGPLINKSLNHW